MNDLDTFIDKLATAVALSKFSGQVSASEVEKIKQDLDLRERVADAIFKVVMEKLPKEKMEEFERIVSEGDESAIQKSFEDDIKKIENLEALVIAAAQSIEKEI